MIILFKNTINETKYNLETDLVLVDYDEMDGDILATFDLLGITLEYISTKDGLVLDSAYCLDGGYCYFDVKDFNVSLLNNTVENLVLDFISGK